MANDGELSFSITNTIAAGQEDDVVFSVQRYLRHFGYLKAGFTAKLLDTPTREALITFQRRRQIDATGEIDEATVAELMSPRCSMPDFVPLALDEALSCVSFSPACTYKGFKSLTYVFENFDIKTLDQGQIETQIGAAFEKWRGLVGIYFVLSTNLSSPLKIGFYLDGHFSSMIECCIKFDYSRGRLGHAFPPGKSCAGKRAGFCHFDAREDWQIGRADGGVDFHTVALHEIGHLLGLSHSTKKGSVMFDDYKSMASDLQQDDIDRILKLYS